MHTSIVSGQTAFYCLKSWSQPQWIPHSMRIHAADCKLNGLSFECTGLYKLLLPPHLPINSPSLPFFLFSSLIQPLKPKRLVNMQPHPKLESAGGGEEGEGGEEGRGAWLPHPSFSLPPWKQHPIPVVVLHSIIVCAHHMQWCYNPLYPHKSPAQPLTDGFFCCCFWKYLLGINSAPLFVPASSFSLSFSQCLSIHPFPPVSSSLHLALISGSCSHKRPTAWFCSGFLTMSYHCF